MLVLFGNSGAHEYYFIVLSCQEVTTHRKVTARKGGTFWTDATSRHAATFRHVASYLQNATSLHDAI